VPAELRFVVEGRRVYQFALLPLEAAVVTFEQADGSTVWQRPLGGIALIVDSSGSYARKGFNDDELRDEFRDAGPFLVLDATGTEIMRIQDTPDRPLIEDFRIDGTPAAETEVTVAGLEITDVVAIDNPDGRMVGTGDAVWIATGDSIIRIDAATREVTDSVPINGRIVDLVAARDSLWASTAPTGLGGRRGSSGATASEESIGSMLLRAELPILLKFLTQVDFG